MKQGYHNGHSFLLHLGNRCTVIRAKLVLPDDCSGISLHLYTGRLVSTFAFSHLGITHMVVESTHMDVDTTGAGHPAIEYWYIKS